MFLGGYRFGAGGAIIGFFIGYVMEEMISGDVKLDFNLKNLFNDDDPAPKLSQYQQNFNYLIAAVLRADGYLSKEKIKFTKHYVYRHNKARMADFIMRNLNELVQNPINILSYAEDLSQFIDDSEKIELFSMLHELAMQNGYLELKERILLQEISVGLKLAYSEFERIVNRVYKRQVQKSFSDVNSAYNELNIDASVSDAAFKKAYRKLVLKYHPDKLKMPTEGDNERFDRIHKAYEKIKLVRNIK